MKSALKTLVLAGMLLGAVATADAAIGLPHRRFHRAPRVALRHRIVRPYYYGYTRHPVPPRVIQPLPAPGVIVVTQPAVSTRADELKAEIAELKDEYYRLFKVRTHLKSWLNGVGKSKSAAARAQVQARHDAVDAQCRALVAKYADLQAQLAQL